MTYQYRQIKQIDKTQKDIESDPLAMSASVNDVDRQWTGNLNLRIGIHMYKTNKKTWKYLRLTALHHDSHFGCRKPFNNRDKKNHDQFH